MPDENPWGQIDGPPEEPSKALVVTEKPHELKPGTPLGRAMRAVGRALATAGRAVVAAVLWVLRAIAGGLGRIARGRAGRAIRLIGKAVLGVVRFVIAASARVLRKIAAAPRRIPWRRIGSALVLGVKLVVAFLFLWLALTFALAGAFLKFHDKPPSTAEAVALSVVAALVGGGLVLYRRRIIAGVRWCRTFVARLPRRIAAAFRRIPWSWIGAVVALGLRVLGIFAIGGGLAVAAILIGLSVSISRSLNGYELYGALAVAAWIGVEAVLHRMRWWRRRLRPRLWLWNFLTYGLWLASLALVLLFNLDNYRQSFELFGRVADYASTHPDGTTQWWRFLKVLWAGVSTHGLPYLFSAWLSAWALAALLVLLYVTNIPRLWTNYRRFTWLIICFVVVAGYPVAAVLYVIATALPPDTCRRLPTSAAVLANSANSCSD